MKKTKNNIKANYLEKVPSLSADLEWSVEEEKVILHIKNKGIIKRITQILIRKPKVSHIHLDEHGSFVWQLIDGKRSILEIGDHVKEHFGEKAEPLYPRLAQFFRILEDNKLIKFI